MAFLINNLTTIGGLRVGGAPKLHLYRTTDSVATCNTAGYFNAGTSTTSLFKGAYHKMSVGDVIFVSVVDSLTVPTALTGMSMLIVNAKHATGYLDTTDGTLITTADGD